MSDPPSAGTAAGGWRGIWDVPRARRWLVACVAAAWLPLLGAPANGWWDFSAFYAAGHFAFTPEVVRIVPIAQWQQANGLPITPFVYPSWLALLYVPFAGLAYDLAALLHVLLQLAFLLAAAILGARVFGLSRGWSVLGTLAWGPAAAGVISGQNTALALLLVVLGASALEAGRPWLAGLATGVLAYKPQLALPIGLTLAWRGAWRAVGGAVVVLGLEYLLGVLATGGGWAWPQAWLGTVQQYTVPDFIANGWQAISLPAFLGRLALGGGEPGSFTGPALLGYLLAAVIVLRCLPALRSWTPARAVALACAAGLLISPHAWVYDATLLLPALAVCAVDARARGWPWQDRWLLAATYALAVTWPLGGLLGSSLLVLVVVFAPFALLGWWPFSWVRSIAQVGPAASNGVVP